MNKIAVFLTLAAFTATAVAGIPVGTIGAKDATLNTAQGTHAPAPLSSGPPPAVPEVQEYAAMAGAALIGFEALRRRRNARKA